MSEVNKKIVFDGGKAYWNVSDYGTLSVPPSDEASTILLAMTDEERRNFNDLLDQLQKWHERAARTPGLLLHPEARACLWGAALAQIADYFRGIEQNRRALFFAGAAWNISKYPVFAFNTALLSFNEGDIRRAGNLLQKYLDCYKDIPKSATMRLVDPTITIEQLEALAETALAQIKAL
jgi:hypothetical protein